MKMIFLEFDEARRTGILPKEPINASLGRACWKSYQEGLERPDFADTVFTNEIKEIVADCKKHGIKEFTVSNEGGGIQRTLAVFIEHGCRLEGLTKVNDKDAFLMEV